MSAGFDQDQWAILAALADHLVPAAERMPQASAVGMPGALLDQVLNARPDLRTQLLQLLRRARGVEPAQFIAGLYRDDPEGLHVLGLVVAGGYYLSPEVRRRLGYPGQTRQSFDPDTPAEYLTDGTLQRVIDRGPIWRNPDMATPGAET
jgi:non-ribosomal peptide synthetase component F